MGKNNDLEKTTTNKIEPLEVNQVLESKSKDFQLELYKFLLGEIKTTNEDKHKYITLYQTVTLALIGAGAYVFLEGKKLELDTKSIKDIIFYLLIIFNLFSVFVIVLVLLGIIAWKNYRKEEKELLNSVLLDSSFRDAPKNKNLWKWSETWLIVFLIIFTVAINILTKCFDLH